MSNKNSRSAKDFFVELVKLIRGTKGSSSGSREQGPAAREVYTEIKTVQINP